MSKESNIEAQIQHFYDNVPNVDDAFPLKEYLLKHEDSRMAWYLLGKQYEGNGDASKAKYCFAQAGDIYAAFEGKPAPTLPNPPRKKEGNKKRGAVIWALVFAVLIAGIGTGLYGILQQKKAAEAKKVAQEAAASASPDSKTPASQAPASQTASAQDEPLAEIPILQPSVPGIISAASGPQEAGQRALLELLASTEDERARLLVRAPELGDWSDWVKSGEPVASVATDGDAGASAINWYDPQWCNCTPLKGSPYEKTVQSWMPEQEAKLVLRSAMVNYHERTGRWPADQAALNGSYPNNTIAGWNEEMTSWFEEMKAPVDNKKDGKIPQTVAWPTASGPESGRATPAGQYAPIKDQPIEIVVDTENNRLAVVSGKVLLRNYVVGLGKSGTPTPEGSFVITEKVRDPNGRSDGAFGSRGMTLSDSRYGIHGTDEPDSVGKNESHGCVRMKKEDIEELFDLVPLGTKVSIAKGGLPDEPRAPQERFRLSNAQDETNPRKVYDWLN